MKSQIFCVRRQMSQVGNVASTIWFCILIFMHFHCSMAMAQIGTSGTRPTEGKLPIHIESDLMEAMDKSGIVVFTGHVKATRGNLIIRSDKLEVFYEKRKQGVETKKAVKKTVATGHVRITQGERVGTGEKAVYDKPAEKITITGDAQVLEGPNRVSGKRIIFFINEDRSIVEGSSETKVKAVIYPAE
ncbi:MAG: lipopolysaccharide transport periplasmic protein LptA [Deltaproteobacteria bacterium]|nr:lipopolysaccharide transport periplasmic protein LptA [Deltaproteobacteria bacterium]MBW1719027.1 lipopolysaccharide transport periplasmic protein LptA [Deltaproteobacteria bacterium]MBW1932447.1 lipopolysaccharide transport periplasmic protein LptA [Deltaproteobacteria bacterium]MBW1937791.1 lipopolysaccharide transport periplasmic protein LptA [Deltaproteobacteria bacterium]MBW1963926.1 lipopolysaccharide transport periplasmic protein LptA [Deltaproteobacteria bacterium]